MHSLVMVPLDGSPDAEAALPWALLLARKSRGSVKFVSVHAPPAVFLDGQTVVGSIVPDDEIREIEANYLTNVISRFDAQKIPATNDIIDGSVVTSLAEYAKRVQPQWIVMISHGRGLVARFFLGETASEFVRESPCPVLLVHPHHETADIAVPPPACHVLVPLDGSVLAERMIEPAKQFAQTVGADLRLMKVGSPDAAAYLDPIALRVGATFEVREGNPTDAIVASAESRPGTIIALATHGRGGLKKMAWGNVADAVVRHTKLPVLVMRPTE